MLLYSTYMVLLVVQCEFELINSQLCGVKYAYRLNNDCIAKMTEQKNHDMAMKACVKIGGTLLSIRSQEMQDYLYSILGGGQWMIDGHRDKNKRFVDHNGKELSYLNWGKDEPSNPKEKCIELVMGKAYGKTWNGKWNDHDCSRATGYLCEKKKSSKVQDACRGNMNNRYNNFTCIGVMTLKLTHVIASATCKRNGGSLLRITSQHMQDYVERLLLPILYNEWRLDGHRTDRTTQEFKDSKREKLTYTNWARGALNKLDYYDDCISYFKTDKGSKVDHGNWRGSDCYMHRVFLCEKSLDPRITCDDRFYQLDNMCIKVGNMSKNKKDAEAACVKLGAHLLTITSWDMEIFVKELIKKVGFVNKKYRIDGERDNNNVFKDYTKKKTVNQKSAEWFSGQPNSRFEKCITVNTREDKAGTIEYGWDDRPCDGRAGYICGKVLPFYGYPEGCNKNYVHKYGTMCYSLIKSNMTYGESKTKCEATKGHLLTITSQDMQNHVHHVIKMYSTIGVWRIDGKRNMDKQGNVFDDWRGRELKYKYWGPGEPNSNTDGCITLNKGIQYKTKFYGRWNDERCNIKRPFICGTEVRVDG